MLPVRWGILGAASFVANAAVIPAVLNNGHSEITGFSSLSGGRDLPLSKLGVARFKNYEALISSGIIDAVYIATPNSLHKPWIEVAIKNNVAVLCEKPICTNHTDLSAITNLAHLNNVLVREAYMTAFSLRTQMVRKLIATGRIGSLEHIDTKFSFTLNDQHNYRWQHKLGGGALADVGIYVTEPAIDYCGAPVEIRINAHTMRGDVDETVRAELIFSDGIKASLAVSFAESETQRLHYWGHNGELWLEKPFTPSYNDRTIHIQSNGISEVILAPPSNPYEEMVDAFVTELQTGRPIGHDLARSAQIQEVLDRIKALLPK